MTHETPLSPRPLSDLCAARRRVMSSHSLHDHGIGAAEAAERCRPGGPWRMLLPGVCLLDAGEPTGEERLQAALLYAGAEPARWPVGRARTQPGGGGSPRNGPMLTGFAALTLHGLGCSPALPALERIDVLSAHARRLRSAGYVRIVSAAETPEPQRLGGLPVAPAARAAADAVVLLVGERSVGAPSVPQLLAATVHEGHCEPRSLLRELGRAGVLEHPQVRDGVDRLLARGREVAEGRLHRMALSHRLPAPCWNVDLRLPNGRYLASVDAYWPAEAVAVVLEPRGAPGSRPCRGEGAGWSTSGGPGAVGGVGDRRCPGEPGSWEALERLGIAVVRVAPEALGDGAERQAAIVRTALMAADEREAAEVTVLPR